MTYYAIPKEMSEILLARGILIWQPYVRIIYRAGKKKNDIIVDSLIPKMCNDPIVTVLLSRKTKLVKLSKGTSLSGGMFLKPAMDGYDVMNFFRKAYSKVEEMLEKTSQDFDEQVQLDIDWQRYRAIFILTRRLMERHRPLFRYFVGKTEAHPYAVALFLKSLIENGLYIKKDINVEILSCEGVYYPLVITNDLKVFEIAWRLKDSLTYSWVLDKFPKVREFYENILQRKDKECGLKNLSIQLF